MTIQRRLRIAVTVAALWAPALFALNNRSAVSVNGLDTNPCTTASPCRSFTAAIAATSAGGEVLALDSGGYGSFTVAASLTIGGVPGAHAAITVTSGNGIVVAASTATDRIVIDNLVLIGAGGVNGIVDMGAKELTVIGCLARGFSSNAILLQSTAANLSVQRCTLIDNAGATAIRQEPAGVAHNVLVSGSLLHDNARGIHADAAGAFVVVDTTISANNFEGVELMSTTGTGNVPLVTMKRCTLVHNSTGIRVFISGTGNDAIATVSQSLLAFNAIAVFNNTFVQSFGDNRFVFNGQDITGANATFNHN